MKKSNLYTRTGDLGTTALCGGSRVRKNDQRVEAYGTVDELNAHLGLLRSSLSSVDAMSSVSDTLLLIQNKLFNIGSYLATEHSEGVVNAINGLDHSAINALELAIDALDSPLPPLHFFVLPGGTMQASFAHVARTVCRRAERQIVTLAESTPVDPDVLRYVNRLSDYLFALSRYLNVAAGEEEIAWNPKA